MIVKYTKEELLNLDDRFEYEFSIPFSISEIPNELIEAEEVNCKELVEELLQQNYTLLIQIPLLPNNKAFTRFTTIKQNDSFQLYELQQAEFTEEIWHTCIENEYSNA